MIRHLVRNGLIFSVCILITGCSTTLESLSVVGSGPFKDAKPETQDSYLLELYDDPSTLPEVKLMLEDGDLSQQDISDVRNLYVQCEKQAGRIVTFSENGETIIQPESEHSSQDQGQSKTITLVNGSEVIMSVNTEANCGITTGWAAIESYNHTKELNPDDLDWSELELKCLIENGVYPANTTLAEFKYDQGLTDGNMHGIYEGLNFAPAGVEYNFSDGTVSEYTNPPPKYKATAEEKDISYFCSVDPLGLDPNSKKSSDGSDRTEVEVNLDL
jgi:hypothetical protein